MRALRLSCVAFLIACSVAACSTLPDYGEPLEFDDPQIRAHWIKADEPAPFDGLLINEYTYYRIRVALIEAEVSQ